DGIRGRNVTGVQTCALPILLAGSFNMNDIVESQRGMWNVIPQFLGFVTFLIAGCAEIHRAPFDLPEAEQELTAGYHTEYSGMKFGMFFVGEYLEIGRAHV